MPTKLTLLPHQKKVFKSKSRYLSLVCGYAAGKTHILGIKTAQLLITNRTHGLCAAPIFPQLIDFVLPAVLSALDLFGVKYKFNKQSNNIYTVYGTIYLRSCTNPDSIAGATIGWAVLDEFDLVEDQKNIWKIVTSRMRAGGPTGCKLPQIFVCTTPDKGESSLLYSLFVEKYMQDMNSKGYSNYELVQAKTLDNVYIDIEFVLSDIIDPYKNDPILLDRYVNGKFVTSVDGKCFYNLRPHHFNNDIIHDPSVRYLHVGMDFNVEKSCAIIAEVWGDAEGKEVHVIDEISGMQDTVATCEELKRRYPEHWRAGRILIYPDASGRNRSPVDASLTAFNVLRQHGFNKIITPKKNIGEFSRILRTNIALAKNKVWFNPRTTKMLKKDLDYVKFDKSGLKMYKKNPDISHLSDAFSYLIIRTLDIFEEYQPNSTQPILGKAYR